MPDPFKDFNQQKEKDKPFIPADMQLDDFVAGAQKPAEIAAPDVRAPKTPADFWQHHLGDLPGVAQPHTYMSPTAKEYMGDIRIAQRNLGFGGDFGGGRQLEWTETGPGWDAVMKEAGRVAEQRAQWLAEQNAPVPVRFVDPVTREVQPEELVQYQIGQVMAEDSPLIQAARTGGLQAATAAGFTDSARGRAIGEYAALQVAQDIAMADANTYATNAINNQMWVNNFGLKEVDYQIQSQLQKEKYGQEETLRSQLMMLDKDIRAELLDLEAQYKNQLQASASAATLYSQAMQSVTEILANPDIEYKQPHIDRQIELLNEGLGLFADIGDLDLIVPGAGGEGEGGGGETPEGQPPQGNAYPPFGEAGTPGQTRRDYTTGLMYEWQSGPEGGAGRWVLTRGRAPQG